MRDLPFTMPRRLSKQSLTGSFSSTSTSNHNSSASSVPRLAASLLDDVPPSLRDPSLPLPKLVVFDLDFTLWPFWVDTHVAPPVKPNALHTAVTDRIGEVLAFYPDVPAILQTLPQLASSSSSPHTSIKLGVASRTDAPPLAREMLKALHLSTASSDDNSSISSSSNGKVKTKRALEAFDAGLEIYPSSKVRHFEALQKRTGIAYEDMLFFDDEPRNRDTESLGVTMFLVDDGVSWEAVAKGVQHWRWRRGFIEDKDAE